MTDENKIYEDEWTTAKELVESVFCRECGSDCFEDGKCVWITIKEALEKQKNAGWIPITSSEIDEEERKENGWDETITHMITCQLPDDGDEILISRNDGKWVELVEFCNDGYGVGDDNGHDWLYDVDAWMPLPKGYEVRK